MANKSDRERVCDCVGCNAYGRLEHVALCLDQRQFAEARAELIGLANFLPGNLVIEIGDDDQALLDLNSEDDQ